MKLLAFSVICSLMLAVIQLSLGAPVAETSSLKNGSDAKSAFGQAFDEIVVESTLNVKRKSAEGRQSRNDQAALIRTKRQGFQNFPNFQFPTFAGAVAAAQAQSHDVKSPHGNFGASAAGGQSQALSIGPNGASGAASFAGSQQYRLPNGQTFDVSFGKSVAGSGSNRGSTRAGSASMAIGGLKG